MPTRSIEDGRSRRKSPLAPAAPMPFNLNQVRLVGRLGRDPELRHTSSGLAVANLSLAVSRPVRRADGDRAHGADWVRVTAWRELAERCASTMRKGEVVYVEGRLQSSSYADKDGIARTATVVVASDIRLYAAPGGPSGYEDVDVPF